MDAKKKSDNEILKMIFEREAEREEGPDCLTSIVILVCVAIAVACFFFLIIKK